MTTFPNGIVPHIRPSVNRFSSLLDALESLVFDYGAHLIPAHPSSCRSRTSPQLPDSAKTGSSNLPPGAFCVSTPLGAATSA